MRRLPILQFVTDFRIGGTERQVANLIAGLRDSEFDVHVACFRREGQFLPDIAALRVPVVTFRIHGLSRLSTLWEQWRFARYLTGHRIALVNSYGFYPNMFAIPAARVAGVHSVASIRDTGDHLTLLRRRAQRCACRLADVVVANAEAVREHLLREGYDVHKLKVVHNGIPTARLRPGGSGAPLRAGLGLPPTAPLVMLMARFTPLKGIEYFLQAAASLATRFPEARFVIVGDSVCIGMGSAAYRAALEAQARRLGLLGRVLFLGFREDVGDLLAAARVSVQPSLSEGLSNVVLEAMAAGVPVVATRVGGSPEMVVDGKTGFLVPPRDAGALAVAIGRLLSDVRLARRMGAAGRRRAVSHFSIGALVEKTRSLYRDLLGLPGDVARGGPARAQARGSEALAVGGATR